MSRNFKINTIKNVLFTTQYEMCDVVYRKLLELMLSISEKEVSIEIKENKFTINLDSNTKETIHFYVIKKGNSRTNIGYVNFKKISTSEIEDPILIYICSHSEYATTKPEIYTMWFEEIKKAMQRLINEQKKYENILEGIRAIPMFSPTRQVLIEKE